MKKTDMFNKKTILITGGTGSFGRNFVKYLVDNSQAKKIIVFSRDELKQSQMQAQIKDERLRFFLGDVRDLQRLQRAFHGVDIVVHAAALKQVPTLEYNPFEAVKTNILGSQNVIDAAIDCEVDKVLLISTDKAVQPINLYGSTKLCAEKLFISGNSYVGGKTKFSCVRYGNVIGSRGSIIEILLKNKNQKVSITHEEMTRFWLTLDKAFELVLFALSKMEGGEIFIPKVPSMKLVDLFEALVPGVSREVIGIRPGEKLHEILLTCEEARHAFDVGQCFAILPENDYAFELKKLYRSLLKNSKKIPADFYFSSDNNEHWLTTKDFMALIKKMDYIGE